MRKSGLVATGLFVALLLGVLAGAIWNSDFRGGKPLPISVPQPGGAGASPLDDLGFLRFLVRALHVVLLISVFITIVLFVLVPQYRRQIIRFFIMVAVVGFIAYLVVHSLLNVKPQQEQEMQPAPLGPGEGEAAVASEEQPPSAPDWLVYLLGAVGGALIAWWGLSRFGGRWAPRRRGLGEELAAAAAEAASELRAGAPVADTVARCWLRMVEILSQRAGVRDAPSLTPEEWAEELRRRGFSHQAIQILTRLFEEVRYGNKAAEPRRAEALAALAAIERAYG
ncbi:hypothetical protein DRJ54_03030 [Candidatus Acetothermia bacterium]|nr:MAG: hypothetical protein DRJ54_03030 [Candidatus Acetothermia bacterium]